MSRYEGVMVVDRMHEIEAEMARLEKELKSLRLNQQSASGRIKIDTYKGRGSYRRPYSVKIKTGHKDKAQFKEMIETETIEECITYVEELGQELIQFAQELKEGRANA